MEVYNNIISAAYKAYSNSGRMDGYFASIIFLGGGQQVLIFAILAFLNKYDVFSIQKVIFNDTLAVIVSIIWFTILFLLYPKKKVLSYVNEFERKSKRQRFMWGVLAVLSMAIPGIILIFFI